MIVGSGMWLRNNETLYWYQTQNYVYYILLLFIVSHHPHHHVSAWQVTVAEWLRRTPAKCIPKGARVRTSAVTTPFVSSCKLGTTLVLCSVAKEVQRAVPRSDECAQMVKSRWLITPDYAASPRGLLSGQDPGCRVGLQGRSSGWSKTPR